MLNQLNLNIRKAVILIGVLLCTFMPAAYADILQCDYDRDTNIAEVCGTAKPNAAVSIRVLKNGNIYFENQDNAHASGNYYMSFALYGNAGELEVIIGEEGIKEPFTFKLTYYGDADTALGEINKASADKSELEMKNCIIKYADLLFGAESGIYNTDIASVFRKLADGTEYKTVKALKEKMDWLIVLGKIYNCADSDSMIALLAKNKDILEIADNTAYYTFVNIIDKQLQAEICPEIYGHDYENVSSFKSEFCSIVLTQAVKEANGWGGVKEIIETNHTLLDITINEKVDESFVYTYVMKQSINNWYDIKNAYNEGVSNQYSSSSSGSGCGRTASQSAGAVFTELPSTTKEYQTGGMFSDLDKVPWAKFHIEKLADLKILSGTGDGRFMPDSTVTREEFVKMIILAFGIFDENAKASFSDISYNEWYYGYVASAVEKGIIFGIDKNTFGIGGKISRQDMAVIAYRAAKFAEKKLLSDDSELVFSDRGLIADYAEESVKYLSQNKVINGMDGKFEPEGYATRAQAAVIVSLIRDLENE